MKGRSRILAALLTLTLLISGLPMAAFAEEAAPEALPELILEAAEEAAPAEEPAEEPAVIEEAGEAAEIPEPAAIEEVAAAEEPVFTEEPAAEEPAEEPAVTEEPVISEETETTEEPVTTEEPAAGAEAEATPEVTPEPVVSEEPAATEVPATTEVPAVAETPAPEAEESPAAAELPLGEDAIEDEKMEAVVNNYFVVEEGVLTSYTGYSSIIFVPDGVTAIADSVFEDYPYMLRLVLPESVVSIGNKAFAGCEKLVDVSLPSKLEEIGREAFEGCKELQKISIPGSVKEIGDYAFLNCEKLMVYIERGCIAAENHCLINGLNARYSDGSQLEGVIRPTATVKPEETVNPDVTAAPTSTATATPAPTQEPETPAYGLSLNCAELTVGVKEKFQLEASVYPESDGDIEITYASANSKIASVGKTGIVTGKKAGETVITVTAGDMTAECSVKVVKAPSKIKLSKTSLSMGAGQLYELGATLNNGNEARVKYTTSSKKVVTVDANGVLTAVGKGSARITVSSYNGLKAACKVTVSAAPKSVELDITEVTLPAGKNLKLTASVNKGSYASYVFTSSNPDVAAVDEKGNVQLLQPGAAIITVETYNGHSASCAVMVTPAPTQLFVDAALDLGVGEKRSLKPTNDQGCEIEYTFASSNKKIATVSKAGKITAVKAGTAEITVTSYNGLSAVCTVTVGKAPSKVTLSETALTLEEGDTASISAAVNAGSFGAVSFSSADKKIATVDENGLITAVKAGKVKITAKSYNGKTATCTVTVIEPVLPLEATVTVNTTSCLAGTELVWTVNVTGGYGKKSIRFEQIQDGALKKVTNSSSKEYTLIAHADGTYSMDVTVTDEMGSSVTASSPVTEVRAVYTNVDARFKRVVEGSESDCDSLFNCYGGYTWTGDMDDYAYVIWEMTDAVSITGYTMVTWFSSYDKFYGRNPASWELYGCNREKDPGRWYDGWVLLDSVEHDKKLELDLYTNAYDYTLNKPATAYKYYMLKITATQGSSKVNLAEFMLNFPGNTAEIDDVDANRTHVTKGTSYIPYNPSKDKDRITIPSLQASLGDGLILNSAYPSEDGASGYSYKYEYGDSCYQLMHTLASDMTETGSYKLVAYEESGASSYWYMQYIGGGTVKPLGTKNGQDYHVEFNCYAYNSWYDWGAFMYIRMGAGIYYGDGYNNPPPAAFVNPDASVTVTDFAGFLDGTKLQQAYKSDSGSCYYQYEYKYGDSVYEVVSMYVNSLVSTGLFRKVDFERYDLMCHWYLQYTGPGANELDTLGTQNGSAYHIKVDCGGLYFPAEYRYMYMTSIRLCNGIALGDTVWVKGMAPNSFSKPEAMAGFKIKKVSTTMLCPTCRGSGICHLCNGTGTYRLYGQAVSCSRTCSFCKGEKSYTRDRYYYVRA